MSADTARPDHTDDTETDEPAAPERQEVDTVLAAEPDPERSGEEWREQPESGGGTGAGTEPDAVGPETAYVEEGNRWSGDRPVPTAGQGLRPDASRPEGVVVAAEPDAPVDQAAAAGLPVVREPLLTAEEQQDFLSRWSAVQVAFVDDPIASVRDADTLIAQIASAYSAAFDARREELGSWRESEHQDTESLRLALRRYRSFIGVILPK